MASTSWKPIPPRRPRSGRWRWPLAHELVLNQRRPVLVHLVQLWRDQNPAPAKVPPRVSIPQQYRRVAEDAADSGQVLGAQFIPITVSEIRVEFRWRL